MRNIIFVNAIKRVVLILLLPLHVAAAEVYFSPADMLRNKLVALIEQERESIHMAVYLITDHIVVDALGKAKARGVEVEVVADVLSLEGSWGKAVQLQKYDIPVFIYDGGAQSIMHNKFFIFSRNGANKKLLWTGSYNPTQKANKYNRENVIIEDDGSVVHAYEQEFNRLKKLCRRFSSREKKFSSRFAPSMTELLEKENICWSW